MPRIVDHIKLPDQEPCEHVQHATTFPAGAITIGFISQFNFRDPVVRARSFSGINNSLLRAFEDAGYPLTFIGPIRHGFMARSLIIAGKILKRLTRGHLHFRFEYCPFVLDSIALRAESAIKRARADLVFCIDSTIIAHYSGKKPYFLWRDANFADLVHSYSEYAGMESRSISWAHAHEKRAMSKSLFSFFSSQTSVDSAVKHYQISPDRAQLIPYGANLPEYPSRAEIAMQISARDSRLCRLVMIGIDFNRKGGDTVLQTCRILRQLSFPFHLDIIGASIPIPDDLKEVITTHGFLDKMVPTEWCRFREILSRSHFLFHPARAEAFGCVMVEAAAFGVPTIGTAVGGLRTIIVDGQTGKLLAPGSVPADYAEQIIVSFKDIPAYQHMAAEAHRQTVVRLNWDVSVRQVLQKLVTS